MLDLLPNTYLMYYRIVSKIGAGGMGEVYLAEDTRLERKVALKFLPAAVAQDRMSLKRFTQEARAASALNHPNILTVHEIGQMGDSHFIATEFVEGESLRERMARDRFELDEVLEISVQIASALAAAHAAGILHRDIKPENVMVRGDGYIKVLDFGLAKLTERQSIGSESPTLVHTDPGVVMGTVSYMSPEQARGVQVDARTDIWSLGCVLYEMVAGKLPFTGATASDVIASILKSEPATVQRFLPEMPAELERIIAKTLAKDREERYQTAKDLWVDLRRLKKQVEVGAEIKRTASANKTSMPLSEHQTQILAARPTLSAKYVVSEIRSHKRGLLVALLAVLLAAISFGYWFFVHRSPNAVPIQSIAILPFVNDSGNPDNEYLSDGMTESLISSLSQLPNLSVKARSSVFRYKGSDANPQTVGNELSVQAVLLGRMVQRGERLRLSLELVDARTENVIWSEQYERGQTELTSLQSEIVLDVIDKLRVRLSGAEEQRVTKNYMANTEAYQLYLRGLFHANKRTPQDLRSALEYYQQAITVDPNYPLAFAGLSDAYRYLSDYEGATPSEAMPKAKENALKALSLDNDLAEAHSSLCNIFSIYDYDFANAERECKRAIELKPNYATARHSYGLLLTRLGRHEESFAEFRRALEIEPLSLVINKNYGESLLYARRYEESVAQLKKTLELDANFAPAHFSLAVTYQAVGRYAESVEELAKEQELLNQSQNAALMRESFARDGWHGFLQLMTGERRSSTNVYSRATYSAELGERDRALAALNEAYEQRMYRLGHLKVDPRLDSLRDDPRFQDLLRRVGLAP